MDLQRLLRDCLLKLDKEEWISIADTTATTWHITLNTLKAQQFLLSLACVVLYKLECLEPWEKATCTFYHLAGIESIEKPSTMPALICEHYEDEVGLEGFCVQSTPVLECVTAHEHLLS